MILSRLLFCMLLLVSSFSLASPGVGDIAPNIDLPFLDGSTQNIAKSHTEFTIIEFSSYHCGMCRLGIPNLKNLAQRLEGIATIKLVMPNSRQKCQLFLDELGVDFSTAFDLDFVAFDAYGVLPTPHLFVVNRDQKIIYTHKETMLDEEITEHIYELITGH